MLETIQQKLPLYTGKNSEVLYTDTYNDCLLVTVKGADEGGFYAYLNDLQTAGFETVTPVRNILGCAHLQIVLVGNDLLLNAVFVADKGEVKLTAEPRKSLDVCVFQPQNAENNASAVTKTLFIQVGMDAEGDTGDHGSCMCYIIRLSDGRFIIYDGGLEDKPVHHATRIYTTLKKYAVDPNHIVIAAWYITHPHIDHIGGLMEFSRVYLGTPRYEHVSLERVICYLPDIEGQTYKDEGRDWQLPPATIKKYNDRMLALEKSGTQIFKAHTGQVFHLGNAAIEVLFTYDLISPDELVTNMKAVPALDENGQPLIGENGKPVVKIKSNEYTNSFSAVSRITLTEDGVAHTLLMTGDTTNIGIHTLNRMYGNALRSEFVQVQHHGVVSQFPAKENAETDEEKYADYFALDLFYGDNTTRSQLLDELEKTGKTCHYSELYTEEGYGYVRAKYVIWPTSIKGAVKRVSGGEKEGARRSTWCPIHHLAIEVGDENCFVAGSTLTVFEFDGADVRVESLIPFGDMSEDIPITPDGQ